jgi:hypothetical protein
MDDGETTVFFRALRGAPMTILMALLVARKPVGNVWLHETTGYNLETVSKNLDVLQRAGYAQNIRRYDGWCLTLKAAQLPLFTHSQEAGLDDGSAENPYSLLDAPHDETGSTEKPDSPEDGTVDGSAENPRSQADTETDQIGSAENPHSPLAEPKTGSAENPHSQGQNGEKTGGSAENPRSPALRGSGGGSSFNIKLNRSVKPPPPQTPPNQNCADNSRPSAALDAEATRLVEALCTKTACPRHRAEQAIEAALGIFLPVAVEAETIRWMAYVRQSGANIRSPGHFVAAKLAAGDEAPDWVELTNAEKWEVERLLAKLPDRADGEVEHESE